MFDTPVKIALFIFGLFGALTTIGCFVPQGIKTLITRDTSGLSKWFFIIALTSSAFWLLIGSLSIVDGAQSNAIWNGILAGLPSIITNVVTVIINSTILMVKLRNMSESKKQGITEQEYCNRLSAKNSSYEKIEKFNLKLKSFFKLNSKKSNHSNSRKRTTK
ncbi:MAG: SemiSWEET family sugar transporter [Mycoplasma sp.]